MDKKAGKIKKGGRDKEQEKDETTGFCCQIVAPGASGQPSKDRGWTEHAEERSGLLYGTTGRQTGTEMQDRESRRGRDLETQERGRERKGQKGERLTTAHLCRHVNADADTKYRLSKYAVKFWI